MARSQPTRVNFGEQWLQHSIVELFHEQICRFRPIMVNEPDSDPFAQIAQMSVHELKDAGPELQILDVRSNREWKGGHVPRARHIFLSELWKRLGELDKSKPTAVYCASGYRASIAASILKAEGFANVRNVPGSWHAWREARYPVDRNAAQEKAA